MAENTSPKRIGRRNHPAIVLMTVLFAVGAVFPVMGNRAHAGQPSRADLEKQAKEIEGTVAQTPENLYVRFAEALPVSIEQYEEADLATRVSWSLSFRNMLKFPYVNKNNTFLDVEDGIKENAGQLNRKEPGSAFTAFYLSQGVTENPMDDGDEAPFPDAIQRDLNYLTMYRPVTTTATTRSILNEMVKRGDLDAGSWQPLTTTLLMLEFDRKRQAERKEAGLEFKRDAEFPATDSGAFFKVLCAVTGSDYQALYPKYLKSLDRPVVTYTETGYAGSQYHYDVGQFSVDSEKSASSIRIRDGYRVVLFKGFSDDDFARVFTEDTEDVGEDVRDQMPTRILVQLRTDPLPDHVKALPGVASASLPEGAGSDSGAVAATIYLHGDFGGVSQDLKLGRYGPSDLKIGNKELSSLKVTPGYRVLLFAGKNFRGLGKSFTADARWVGDDFNDMTSSIIVQKADDAIPADFQELEEE